jgi:hypothetical protein
VASGLGAGVGAGASECRPNQPARAAAKSATPAARIRPKKTAAIRPEVGRCGGRALARRAAVRVEVFRDQPIRVQTQIGGVLAHEGLGEDASRKHVRAVLLERLQEAQADVGRLGNVTQVDAAQLAFPAESLAEGGHGVNEI